MNKRIVEMLDNHIEFAEKTNKLHDVGNFELIKTTIENQAKEIEELNKANKIFKDLVGMEDCDWNETHESKWLKACELSNQPNNRYT